MPEWKRGVLHKRTLFLVGALGLLLLAASSDTVQAATGSVVRIGGEIIDQYPLWGPLAFVAVSAASAMLAFFSSVPLLPVAVTAWGEWPTFLLLWGAWMLGGAVSYVLGRTLGPRVMGWFVEAETLTRYESMVNRRAGFPTILLFQLAVPSEIPGYVLGTLRYRAATYGIALALAELPYAISSVFLSGSFLRREYTTLVVVGVAAVALSTLALRRLNRTLDDDQQ